jgi:hypothetical protein
MEPAAILLSVTPLPGKASYRFRCPSCRDPVERRADDKVVELLLSAGVDMGANLDTSASMHPAAHRSAPGKDQDGAAPDGSGGRSRTADPPFTLDDLLDFHLLLHDDRRLRKALLFL